MRVTSAAGTDLAVPLAGAFVAGSTGRRHRARRARPLARRALRLLPGAAAASAAPWCWRRATSTSRSRATSATPVTLRIEDDHVVAVEGDGLDADLLRSHLAAFGDARRVRHLARRLGHEPRPPAGTTCRCTTARRSTAPRRAPSPATSCSRPAPTRTPGRFTRAHFDLPLRGCTVDAGRPRRGRRRRAVRRAQLRSDADPCIPGDVLPAVGGERPAHVAGLHARVDPHGRRERVRRGAPQAQRRTEGDARRPPRAARTEVVARPELADGGGLRFAPGGPAQAAQLAPAQGPPPGPSGAPPASRRGRRVRTRAVAGPGRPTARRRRGTRASCRGRRRGR